MLHRHQSPNPPLSVTKRHPSHLSDELQSWWKKKLKTWIDSLCTCDDKFPIAIWCQLVEQGQLTLNLMRTLRTNPCLLAYEVLEGLFDFNRPPDSTRNLINNIRSARQLTILGGKSSGRMVCGPHLLPLPMLVIFHSGNRQILHL